MVSKRHKRFFVETLVEKVRTHPRIFERARVIRKRRYYKV